MSKDKLLELLKEFYELKSTGRFVEHLSQAKDAQGNVISAQK